MNSSRPRNLLKEALGIFPASARIYQSLQPAVVPAGAYAVPQLEERLPGWISAMRFIEPWQPEEQRKRILLVGSLKWWLEYGILLGLMLESGGHRVDLAYLPYRDWTSPVTRFDALRGAHYLERRLSSLRLPLGLRSLIAGSPDHLDRELEMEMEAQARLDVQYTMQREAIDIQADREDAALYRLRLARNRLAAASTYELLRRHDYDVVVIPNGSILEFGAIYRTVRHLGVDSTTYEFGEQRERLWLAQNGEVMRQDTSDLWSAVRDIPLQPQERALIERLFQARRGGQTWEQFKRQWQAGGSEGAQRTRAKLGLEPDRPVILLCTNVVGDSLALNRQVFTDGMADWLARTVALFAELPEYQLVVRVHPGEMLGAGHPSVEIVKDVLPHKPDHVIVVPPESDINTYDLIEMAHLGLVYTTTVGLEMCMHAVPVIAAGATHYKGKGFTDDPQSWEEYEDMLHQRLNQAQGSGLPDRSVEAAWRYAYRFFFDYPFKFPWHLISFWDDVEQNPFESVLEDIEEYIPTLNAFAGMPIDWRARVENVDPVEVPFEG
ncbi:MAG: hypothetical protein P1P76_02220 [Anaerolineales bacterium]|nr:hypothetical protein [Anaerolineales bacterium]